MKSYVLLFALLPFLGCSGAPAPNSELEAMASRGLQATMTEVNAMHAISYLYRPTRAFVKRVIPLGANTMDLMMKFDIKETDCTKASGSDPMTCAFRSGFFVPTLSCSSRVRVTATSTQVVSFNCGRDSSSSSESSEECDDQHVTDQRNRYLFNSPGSSSSSSSSTSTRPVHSLPPQPDGGGTAQRGRLQQLGGVKAFARSGNILRDEQTSQGQTQSVLFCFLDRDTMWFEKAMESRNLLSVRVHKSFHCLSIRLHCVLISKFNTLKSSSGGGGGSAMSSMVPAGSSFPERPAELREPCRPTDFRFSVRLRSSRKLGWPELPFGEVGGGGESGGGSGVVLLRRASVGGAVFFSELFPHVELLTRETGGGGGGACGWGLTTATLGGPPLWASPPGGGGGGKSSEAGGGGGK
ncbi:hypothetical protein INR49_008172 [Caranx melampygus]|nr:hypothetical protein INR49_008172 [Caranx melampygus]